jgi:hypothetical protein
MAIRLTDIVTVMKSKWTYGDKFFGYTEEFNDNHNTQYPSILITPPDSVFPEVSLNNGWELYTFEIYFSDLYNRTAQANVNIEQRWDNLQDLANEWLDMFLKNYQDGIVTGFLEGEDVTVERVKEVANDKLLQIRMNFTWKVFSKCFRPQSVYPTDIANLAGWYRADSGVTFDIPTKRVSAWQDYSASGNNLAQSNKNNQALRYTYDGANDKTRIQFNGTSDNYPSESDSILGNAVTMFFVVKNTLSAGYEGKYFSYTDGNVQLNFGTKNGLFTGYFSDANSNGGEVSVTGALTSSYHIAVAKLHNKTLYLEYNNTLSNSLHDANYDHSTTHDQSDYTIGYKAGAAATNYFKGDMQEIIIYNSALEDYTIGQIKSYLNKKYNIY